MIAIHTKYIKASNTRGSRIKAYTTTGFTAVIPYPYNESDHLCHFEAVKALVSKHKLDWPIDDMVYGDSADNKGYSFCFECSKVGGV